MMNDTEWSRLSLEEKSMWMDFFLRNGIDRIDDMIPLYNEYQRGGFTSGNIRNAVKSYGTEGPSGPNTHYEELTTLPNDILPFVSVPDSRGHYSDGFKTMWHPSGPQRGMFDVESGSDVFRISDSAMKSPEGVNYTMFGLTDNGDGHVKVVSDDGVVLPELTVTPSRNYYHNTYDDTRIFAKGGSTSPDYEQENPYHYHNPQTGKKVAISQEALEEYKDKPYFSEIRNAVEAERAAYPEQNVKLELFQYGGPITTPYGQWKYPGDVTRIPSNEITMKGVGYPVLGVSDTGDTKMMYPGEDYRFDGRFVTEYPMMFQSGGYADGQVLPYEQYYNMTFAGNGGRPLPEINIVDKKPDREYNEYTQSKANERARLQSKVQNAPGWQLASLGAMAPVVPIVGGAMSGFGLGNTAKDFAIRSFDAMNPSSWIEGLGYYLPKSWEPAIGTIGQYADKLLFGTLAAEGMGNLTHIPNYEKNGRYSSGNVFNNIGNIGIDAMSVIPVGFGLYENMASRKRLLDDVSKVSYSEIRKSQDNKNDIARLEDDLKYAIEQDRRNRDYAKMSLAEQERIIALNDEKARLKMDSNKTRNELRSIHRDKNEIGLESLRAARNKSREIFGNGNIYENINDEYNNTGTIYHNISSSMDIPDDFDEMIDAANHSVQSVSSIEETPISINIPGLGDVFGTKKGTLFGTKDVDKFTHSAGDNIFSFNKSSNVREIFPQGRIVINGVELDASNNREFNDILSKYIDRIESSIGGDGIVVGSTRLIANGFASGAPNDTEILTTQRRVESLMKKLRFKKMGDTANGTGYCGTSDMVMRNNNRTDGIGNDGPNVDINIIREDAGGNAYGTEAEEIAGELFGYDYISELRSRIADAYLKGESLPNVQDGNMLLPKNDGSGKFWSADELLDMLKEQNKVVQKIVNDNSMSTKTKHGDRFLNMLVRTDEESMDVVSRAIHQIGRQLGGKNYKSAKELYANIDLSNEEANIEFLEYIGFPKQKIDEFSKNSRAMENILDKWLIDETYGFRGVEPYEYVGLKDMMSVTHSVKGGSVAGGGGNTKKYDAKGGLENKSVIGAVNQILTYHPEKITSTKDILDKFKYIKDFFSNVENVRKLQELLPNEIKESAHRNFTDDMFRYLGEHGDVDSEITKISNELDLPYIYGSYGEEGAYAGTLNKDAGVSGILSEMSRYEPGRRMTFSGGDAKEYPYYYNDEEYENMMDYIGRFIEESEDDPSKYFGQYGDVKLFNIDSFFKNEGYLDRIRDANIKEGELLKRQSDLINEEWNMISQENLREPFKYIRYNSPQYEKLLEDAYREEFRIGRFANYEDYRRKLEEDIERSKQILGWSIGAGISSSMFNSIINRELRNDK